MKPRYHTTVTVGTNWTARCLDIGERVEAHGDAPGAVGWYRSAALNAPDAPEPLFRLGTLLFKQGQAAEAETAFRRAIALRPDYLDAYLNLGATLHRQGKLTEAVATYERALGIIPIQPDLHYNLGVALYHLGDFAGAAAWYERALEQRPVDAGTHYQLGITLHKLGRFSEAIAHCERSVAIDSGYSLAHLALGNFLAERDELIEAIARYHRALSLNSQLVEAHLALGHARFRRQELVEAARCYERALELKPGDPAVHYYLGTALEKAGREGDAVVRYEETVDLDPEFAAAHCGLARILRDRGELRKARARFERAIALAPDLADAHLGLAVTLELQGQFTGAISRFKKALALEPDRPEIHAAFGMVLLRENDFAPGLQEYEWRLQLSDPMFQPRPGIPRWKGDPLNGERILLYAEQGLGDTLQFVRYAPMVAALGGRVVLGVQDELRRLLSTMPDIDAVVSRNEPPPDVAWQCPLMSFPLVFGTELATVPSTKAYLFSDEDRLDVWARRLAGDGLRVGLNWAGNPAHKRDRERSIEVTDFEPLFDIPRARFFSLQRGPRALDHTASGAPIIDLAADLHDLADTAAAIAALDLVVTVDTSVAHLAGALGKEVWILLPHPPDWRWLLERDDSPWYPTARLFRQPRPGAWNVVLDQVVGELKRRITGSANLHS